MTDTKSALTSLRHAATWALALTQLSSAEAVPASTSAVKRTPAKRKRAIIWELLNAWLLLDTYTAPPAPNSATPVNINYVFGMNDKAAQTYMQPLAWLAMLMVVLPTLLYLPTHWALLRFFPQRAADRCLDKWQKQWPRYDAL